MKIVLASESKIKIAAVQQAFADTTIELVPISVPSDVPEQPFNEETLTGAFNRLNAAKTLVPDADMYIAIENGIFEEDGHYVDRAIVAIARNGNAPTITYSEGARFPDEAVVQAKQIGFDTTTVGKVMASKGWVQDHADPHKDLIGKSRAIILAETMKAALG